MVANMLASALMLALAVPAAHADEASPDLDGSGALSVQEIVHHWLSADDVEARADAAHRSQMESQAKDTTPIYCLRRMSAEQVKHGA